MIPIRTKADGSPQTREQAVEEPSPSSIILKPIPQSQAQDPRRYQIEQLRKRFSPRESITSDGSTSLVFKLTPSDPDFPFELAYLECDLRVPEDYPEERPVLLVRNKDIPRGFSINVERGWDRLVLERKGAVLLALTRALDKNLEGFLSEQKVNTVKLVTFQGEKDTRHIDAAHPAINPPAAEPVTPVPKPKPLAREPSFTRDQIFEAKARRAQEVRQLEARMGRMDKFRRSADGVVFTLPIEPKRRAELPPGLKAVNSMHLIVPLLYPLQDLRIQLNEAGGDDAEPVEELFVQKAATHKHMALMSHVNYLVQNLHSLAKQAKTAAKVEIPQASNVQDNPGKDDDGPSEPSLEEKSHVHVIPRPPEWSLVGDDSNSGSDDCDSEDSGGGVALETPKQKTLPEEAVERGTMISFPSVELHGIELLQVSILGITVKCERCKTANEVTGLKSGFEKTVMCKKCNAPLAAKFQQQLIHEHSSRAGFIDLSGCKVADMLPSTFIPTCAKCSAPGLELVSVPGETMSNVCRECHGKFTFKIPNVKFLFITPGSLPPPTTGPRRKGGKLGLHAGEPLPNKGACEHYRKSYRWFRFSCCSKVYFCDRCHDEAEDHVNEWANRMICGWCSREQNYAVEDCGFCGRSVVRKTGKGFWEGGKGTRDQRTMSRKDPRKHKRIGGSQANKKG